jgi:hypothetical protein
MAIVNLTRAAALAGVSRNTLYRHISRGKLSTTRLPDGNRGVDTAELQRVFGTLTRPEERHPVAPRDVTENSQALQREVELLREQAQLYKEQLEGCMHERNRLLSIIEQRLLTPPPEPVKRKAVPAEEKPKARKPMVRRIPKDGLPKPAPKKASAKASPPKATKPAPREPAKSVSKGKIVKRRAAKNV